MTDMIDVAIVEDVWGGELARLAGCCTVVREPEAWRDEHRVATLAAASRVLVVRNRTHVGRTLLTAGDALELVARAGAGTDNIDLDAADDLGIGVLAAPGVNAVSVAEHALGLALSVARDIARHDRELRNGAWDRRNGTELNGGTWGVVGFGATGTATARVARAIGLSVLACDPVVTDDDPRLAAVAGQLVDLDTLCAQSDLISLHVPLVPTTRHLFGAPEFARMPDHAILVNVSRGGLVDETALVEALDAGQVGGAGLDVRDHEPPVPGALEAHERVVLTPHVGGLTEAAQARIVDHLGDGIARHLGVSIREGG